MSSVRVYSSSLFASSHARRALCELVRYFRQRALAHAAYKVGDGARAREVLGQEDERGRVRAERAYPFDIARAAYAGHMAAQLLRDLNRISAHAAGGADDQCLCHGRGT